MAYMTPEQWRDSLIGIGQGRRTTLIENPNEVDPNEVLPFTRSAMDRAGTPNFSSSQAASGAYDTIPAQRAPTGTAPTSLQKTLEQLSQSQGGFVGDSPSLSIPFGVEGFVPPNESQQTQGANNPQGMMSKIGGFLRRPGGPRDLGDALTSLGAGMAAESSRPGGSALAGFASGAEMATQSLARSREEARLEEGRAEKARREQAARDAILGDETLADADKSLLITLVDNGDLAGALNRRDRIVDVANLTARMEGIEGISDTDRSTIISLARTDLGAANQFFEGKTDEIAFNTWRQGHVDTNFGLGDEVPQVLSEAEKGWLPLLPIEMQSSFIMDELADIEMRPSVWEGLKIRYFGSDPNYVPTEADREMLDGLVENLEVGTAILGSPRPNISSVEAADGSVKVYRDGILIETLPPGALGNVVPPGLIESLPALKDFNEDFYANQVEYLASRTDLNRLLDTAEDGDFGRLNTLGYELLGLMEGGGSDLEVSKVQAKFLTALNTIGFQNLSLFVGPTSDFEAGLAQMIQGTLALTRDHLKDLASRQLRQRLNLWARHNDRVERAVGRLPEGYLRKEAESHYIRLMPEDVPGFTLDEWQREMGDRSGAGGGSRILFEGKYPVTGAQIQRSGDTPGVTSTAGDFWDIGVGTPEIQDTSHPLDFRQVPRGSVNQMQYPWSTLPPSGGIPGGGVSDLANRQLFPPGQGLLFQRRSR